MPRQPTWDPKEFALAVIKRFFFASALLSSVCITDHVLAEPKTLLQRCPIIWDAPSRKTLREWMGCWTDTCEFVGGVFDKRYKSQVSAFARSVGREARFEDRYAQPLH